MIAAKLVVTDLIRPRLEQIVQEVKSPRALYLYRDWLPDSGEEARDFPIYCQRRLSFIPEMAAHEVVVELFLPLK